MATKACRHPARGRQRVDYGGEMLGTSLLSTPDNRLGYSQQQGQLQARVN